MEWYPSDKTELSKLIDSYFLKSKIKPKIKINEIHGLIVPHAGYEYSGEIAGRAFSLLKWETNNLLLKEGRFSEIPRILDIVVILSPSHYIPLKGIISHNKEKWKTSLGSIDILESNFPKIDISREHAINNQIPFLQKLGVKKILPLLIGEISIKTAKETAKELSKLKAVFIISSDLSHFLAYDEAVKKDKKTIKAIETLDLESINENSACGVFPLLIAIELCKLKKLKPKFIEYKNSGDITGIKESVVGYASFYF